MLHLRHTLETALPNYPIALDVYAPDVLPESTSVVVFMHGFKGFKDWGHWHTMAPYFVRAGHVFVTFNFSHNGTTLAAPTAFGDLEAFGRNTFSRELDDAAIVLQWLLTQAQLPRQGALEVADLTLIGHSRGGPIALISALEQAAVTRVVTWAGVHELNYRWANAPERLEAWKTEGVEYLLNGRTGQQMPLYYSLYEDYQAHQDRLSVAKTLDQLHKPYLIVHGTADPAVSHESAQWLHERAYKSELVLLEGADHVFGGRHPHPETTLPKDSQHLVERTLQFIEQTS